MANTFFAAGSDRLEDMIGSIRRGYLLEQYSSGMEDPRNWGLQGIVLYGREIADGRLTGRLVSPVIMTGYVPDVLGSVSAAGESRWARAPSLRASRQVRQMIRPAAASKRTD